MTEKQKEETIYARDETDFQGRKDAKDMHEELRDLHSSSDLRKTISYDCLQKDIAELYTSIQTLIHRPAFEEHIRPDLHKMGDIDEQLNSRKRDIMMTDCAIVVAGETSSGKSTLINLLIGKDIVPTDTMATTTRVCRIRYSEKRNVSTLDKDEKVLSVTEFDDEKDMTKMLDDVATTCDPKTEYIDICFPVPLLKGNIIIVDTPGMGDSCQEDIANKMLDYLPNAVAFIFVLNVAAAGGIQDDRLLRIVKPLRQSMSRMYSFDPEDAIFLLNKWDTIIPQKRNRKKDLFEQLKENVHEIWDDVKDTNILKFASGKVHEETAYTAEFKSFLEIFEEVISRNEFKRVNVHLRLMESFVDDCDLSLSMKLKCSRQSTEETFNDLEQIRKDLQEMQNKREKAFSSLQSRIQTFLDETAEELIQYIHRTDFKNNVLQQTVTFTRLTIGGELDNQIEKAILSWQENHIECLFERKILQDLKDEFINLHESLNTIRVNIRGHKSTLSAKDRLSSYFAPLILKCSIDVASTMTSKFIVNYPKTACATIASGVLSCLAFTKLVALGVLDKYETVSETSYQDKINKITKEKISKKLQDMYGERFQNVIKCFLEGDLKSQIDDLSESVERIGSKINLYKENESILHSLSLEISKIRNRLEELKNVEIKFD